MLTALETFLTNDDPAILAEVTGVKGSTPREEDAWMLISSTNQLGTIGGGQLEYLVIDHARALLSGKNRERVLDIPLGPEIGQCCGGRMEIRFTEATADTFDQLRARLRVERQAFPNVYIFGAGHTGKALATAMAPLPLQVCIVETRENTLIGLPEGTDTKCVAMPEAIVAEIPSGSAVIVLTHDHTLDFLVTAEALKRNDLAYVGMIGSATKRATFSNWLQRQGFKDAVIDRLTSPIGGKSSDKRPEVIAALTAAEVLTSLSKVETLTS